MQRREQSVYFRVTVSENRQIHALAGLLDMSVSAYVRKSVLHPREIASRLEWPEFKKQLEAIFLEV